MESTVTTVLQRVFQLNAIVLQCVLQDCTATQLNATQPDVTLQMESTVTATQLNTLVLQRVLQRVLQCVLQYTPLDALP